jgi:hypothetical protein
VFELDRDLRTDPRGAEAGLARGDALPNGVAQAQAADGQGAAVRPARQPIEVVYLDDLSYEQGALADLLVTFDQ